MSRDPSDLGFSRAVLSANGREDLIEVFATYGIVPKQNAADQSVAKSEFILERRGKQKPGGKNHLVGEKTRETMIQMLGIDSVEECERVRERITNHPKWEEGV